MNTPTECPKWESCSAAICPMNRSGKHLKGETVCFYAMEREKPEAYLRFTENDLGWLYEALIRNQNWLSNQSGDIRKRLLKSAVTRPRLTI